MLVINIHDGSLDDNRLALFFNNHPFIDGNKRIAFFSADVFLRMNGYNIDCDNDEAHQHFINLFHERRFCIDELAKWIKKNVKKTL